MSDLQPLLARDRYTDEEWEYAQSGRCSSVNYPNGYLERCGLPSDPQSKYRLCAGHDADAREDYPGQY